MVPARRPTGFRAASALAAALPLATVALVACSSGFSVDPSGTQPQTGGGDAASDAATSGDANGSGPKDAGGGTSTDAADGGPYLAHPAACPSKGGPPMVIVPSIRGGFCIDTLEVTVAQYDAFLATSPNAKTVFATKPICLPHSTFAPACTQGNGANPVTCVDWCDAWAFCAWAGKRLCGDVHGGSASADATDTKHEWLQACNGDPPKAYPYGNAYQTDACNGKDHGGTLVKAGSMKTCQGGYTGLYDMSGNVEEWEDACDLGQNCLARGGGITELGGQLTCDTPYARPMLENGNNLGIRCCAD